MKYYLFQETNFALVWTVDPAHPDLLQPYLALSCDSSQSIEEYFEGMTSSWANPIRANEAYKYRDFKMKSDSLDEIIEYAALESL
ncbi:MAG: hypothetical protein PHW03_08965 [Eubacteriales bacterium]|nr:hypothetical protein [Eubacteriales bacterium]